MKNRSTLLRLCYISSREPISPHDESYSMVRPPSSRNASSRPLQSSRATTLARYTVDDVRFLVLSAPVPPAGAPPSTLTAAEHAVFLLLARDLSNSELASRRGCSVPTVAKQVAAIKRKVGCADRQALVILARQSQTRDGASRPAGR